MIKFLYFNISVQDGDAALAAETLKNELIRRFLVCSESAAAVFRFKRDSSLGSEGYALAVSALTVSLCAGGSRGYMYAVGALLGKLRKEGAYAAADDSLSCRKMPRFAIRGHQLGWRTTSNTYEAWSLEQYGEYMRELMYLGANTVEHTVFDEQRQGYNRLMRYTQEEFIKGFTEAADALKLDVSFWYPSDEEDGALLAEQCSRMLKNAKRVNYYFPPGSDPGELRAEDFLERTRTVAARLKSEHKELLCTPSAQAPHSIKGWGDRFIEKMSELPEQIDLVVTGPNAAMELFELRRRLPESYPIRLYPDITHNLRCEYPVHFKLDDWHFSFSSTLGRESINPRPCEMRALHRTIEGCVCGSVSYSEGINDDVNKAVWTRLDFDPDEPLGDIIEDYCRLFFYGADASELAKGIFALEKNWIGDPVENPAIEYTHSIFAKQAELYPFLMRNYRFLMLLFRAKCDLLVKLRRESELRLIGRALSHLACGDIKRAIRVLETEPDAGYLSLRREIDLLGKRLFELIGMQLDIKRYCADGEDRGATLDTVDMPVTDALFLCKRLRKISALPPKTRKQALDALIGFRKSREECFYFSFAEHDFSALGVRQDDGFYMDYQGDRKKINNGSAPMCMLKCFDHYTLKFRAAGLSCGENALLLHILPKYRSDSGDLTITVNGSVVYKGKPYGGVRLEALEELIGSPAYELRCYLFDSETLVNGCADVCVSEEKYGIIVSEIFIVPKERIAPFLRE